MKNSFIILITGKNEKYRTKISETLLQIMRQTLTPLTAQIFYCNRSDESEFTKFREIKKINTAIEESEHSSIIISADIDSDNFIEKIEPDVCVLIDENAESDVTIFDYIVSSLNNEKEDMVNILEVLQGVLSGEIG